MSPPERLVGREPVLRAAASVLRDAFAGAGQFLMISGEAGIGKTAVLAALIDQAGPDCLVLRGFCWDGDGAPPYWPWSQVLQASGLAMTELGDAGWLLETESSSMMPMDAAAAADAQFRLFQAVLRCLIALAARRPVLVVIDDLHWADDASLRLLGFLARAVATSSVVLIGAYRDTESSPELLTLAGDAQHLPLAGLSPAAVASMAESIAGAAPSPQATSQLWRRSGGNPFFVRELARLLIAQGPWHEQSQIPASVAETLRRRLARLPTGSVRLLDWAAVAGRDIDVGLLVDAGAADAEALELLDEARRAGVIVGSRDEARFAHDLYRETILEGLSPATRAQLNFGVGRALQAGSGNAARIAAHLLAGGAHAQRQAIEYSILAAREATARLGHDDACAHYQRAVQLIEAGADDGGESEKRLGLLLEFAAAQERSGKSELAGQRYREAVNLAGITGDAVMFAQAALGVHSLGHRSGAPSVEVLELLHAAAAQLEACDGPLTLQSQVAAAVAREMRHGSSRPPDAATIRTARRAVQLATAAGDEHAIAVAKLALQDSMWTPGSAAQRLPVIAEMLAAATSSHDADLIAQAHLLRAAALIELGDPAGRDELATYISLAEALGHARGRWGALTRRATLAQLAGRAEEAAQLDERALELGRAIGEPDALACFCTSRWSLVALGVPEPQLELDSIDPLWPMFPIFNAWPHAARGDIAATTAALGDFSVLDIAESTGTEGLAAAAVVFAVAGSTAQRSWTYERLLPRAGTHVLVSGCASYHAAVDHHLGTLAAALGDIAAADEHFRAALAMHERLGAAAWARLTEQALSKIAESRPSQSTNEFRRANHLWLLSFAGKQVQLGDSKGLRDIANLIGAQGANVHVATLIGVDIAHTGADPVLDDIAKAQYKARLDSLTVRVESAETSGNALRSEQLSAERDALVHELAAAAGLGGRTRRLGDESERLRKTVSARVRDALSKIDRVHPALADHLRSALRMGTTCSYTPSQPMSWTLAGPD